MIVRVVSVMSSTRFSTRRVMNQPPAQPEHADEEKRPAEGAADDLAQARALLDVAADEQPEAAGQHEDAHDRACARRSPSASLACCV